MTQRREFLKMVAATSVVSLANTASAANEDAKYIDAHVHVWTPDTNRYPLAAGFQKKDMVPASFTPDELFAHCRPHGVGRIVLIQMSFYKFDNSYMLDVIAEHPGVFSGVGIVDENRSDLHAAIKSLAAKGVRGFRLYTDKQKAESWIDSAAMKNMWSYGADEGLAMCLLANPDALPAVRRLCEMFPKTRVVIDHFARIGVSGKIESADLDNLCRLADFANVYVKTSAFYALGLKKSPYTDLADMVRKLRDAYGPKRLMWATDCPYQVQGNHNYQDSVALIRDRLDFLSAADKDWLLRGTAEKVFFS